MTVNGQVVATLGTRIDPARDRVALDGRLVSLSPPRVYLMLHKPAGYLCTRRDPRGRPIVSDLLDEAHQNLFPVGRLDRDTEGLLLLTNDGDFAHRMMHPRFEMPKVYEADIEGAPSPASLERLRRGILLDTGRTAPAKVRMLRAGRTKSVVELTIREGKKRQVRKMLQAIGHAVVRLRRVQFGSLRLGDLPPGKSRPLSEKEVAALLAESDAHGAD